jgi:hypothetical protein
MNPVDLIKRDLGPDEWQRLRQRSGEGGIITLQEQLSCFSDYNIYLLNGEWGQFDFPMPPPYGSYGYYAANGKEAIHLTRVGKEIERILEAERASLPAQNPVKLASLVLTFYDKTSHYVLASADNLRDLATPPKDYRINERSFAKALSRIGETTCTVEGNTIKLRAVTLCGWMHDKRNLGIETIAISKDGTVALGPREVLAENIFDEVPDIIY